LTGDELRDAVTVRWFAGLGEGRMEKRRDEAEKTLIERNKADDAFRANFERLKA
jgi:hypothetical protein